MRLLLLAGMVLSQKAAAVSSAAVVVPTFFVSPAGDDRNPGTEARPFLTVQAAQTAVRALLSTSRSQNVLVVLASGRYTLSAPIVFTAADSPGDGFTVVYTGPPDASAVIVGAQPLTNWERVSPTVLRARLPVVGGVARSFYTLFENGARAMLARSPNTGYLAVAGEVGVGGSKTQFVYAPRDIPDSVDPAAIRIYVWSGVFNEPNTPINRNWEPDIVSVSSIDRTTRTITLASETNATIRTGNRYFVQGDRSLIDQPGEFAVDETGGYVYYAPRAEPIERQEILAPTVPRILDVLGSAAAVARNLAFEHLSLAMSDSTKETKAYVFSDVAAVRLQNADRIALRFSHIYQVGATGVVIRGHAQGNVLSGNLLEDIGVHGIDLQGFLAGTPAGVATEVSGNAVSNNLVRRAGQLNGGGRGILVRHSSDNHLEHNVVREVPRMGIELVGATLEQLQQVAGLGATAQNYRDLISTRGNIVRFSDISAALLDSQDGGGIYTWHSQRTTVEGNRVHDIASGIANGIASGIYLDDGADRAIVRNNILYGIAGPRSAMLKGILNEITNNIFASDAPNSGVSSQQCPACASNSAHDHVTVSRNIFFSPGGTDLYWFADWASDRLTEADRNLFHHPGGTYMVRFRFSNLPADRITLDNWRATYGFDRNSIVADPLFRDAAARDFSLAPNSPALALGFVGIDVSQIGLQSDFPFPFPGQQPSDCFFNWAERTYPTLFAPSATMSSTFDVYYYRYYSQTNSYLATSGNRVYYLGPPPSSIVDAGPLSAWLTTSGCQ